MKARLMAAIAVIAVAVTGCSVQVGDMFGGDSKAAQSYCLDAVRDQLKDPDSAQFKNVEVSEDEKRDGWYNVVGHVNANNSYGAKAGYSRFVCVAHKTDGKMSGAADILN